MESVEKGKLYNLQQVADLTGLALSNLRYWANHGKIRARKFGRAWYMNGAAIQDLVEHGTREAQGND